METEAWLRLLDVGRNKCNPRPIGTLAGSAVSAARGIIPPPPPASTFFKASKAAPADRGVDGRAPDAGGRIVAPMSKAISDDDAPALPANAGPLRLLGRPLPVEVASVGAVKGAGGEPSSLRRDIPSGRLQQRA